MVRGIEACSIFRDERDRADFVRRLASLARDRDLTVYAWALLPNHAHLLLRTGRIPLARVMRSLLTGYAGTFNRRHRRKGHLFQNRYKSIVVEEEAYLLQLTRYIHLNPIRAGIVPNVRALDRYPWTGHSALLGRVEQSWQSVDEVLGQFAVRKGAARRHYRAFVAEGLQQGRRADLTGGGLRRSAGGWDAVVALRRGREGWAFDERILGSGPFVERVLQQASPPPGMRDAAVTDRVLSAFLDRLAWIWGVNPAEIRSGSRRRPTAQARAAVAAAAVTGMGVPSTRVARALGVGPAAICQAIARGLEGLRSRSIDPDRVAKELVRKVK
jgi:REP element-mobilizing transposase RayT